MVGVKADYKPFGYTDPSGKIVGLEIDLAADVINASASSSEARAGHRGEPDGVPQAGPHRPDDRDHGVQARSRGGHRHSRAVLLRRRVFAKKSSGKLRAGPNLKGKPICAIQGAYYNRRTGEEFGAQLVVFKGVTEAMAALEGGNCVGTVFDTTFFAGIMGDAKWADYAMVLPAIDPEPWGVGVRKDDPKFAAYMSDVSRTGTRRDSFSASEKKWGIPRSPFLWWSSEAKFK